MASPEYKVLQGNRTDKGIKYFFVSKGKADIVKAVDYAYVQNFREKKIFNLGFGDYDLNTGKIDDFILTDNGDTHPVFYTVLSTVPLFFEAYPQSMMIVRGSDSSADFEQNCRAKCIRNCTDNCKKAHRRINLYCKYVNKHYEELSKEFSFYGGAVNAENKIIVEDYIKEKKYKAVLVVKK